MPVVNDALNFIGSATPPPVENKALKDLETKLAIQNLTNRSLEDRTSATNISNEIRTLAPLGLERGDSAGLARLNEGLAALRGGRTADTYTSGGYRTSDPSISFLPEQFPSQLIEGGFPFKGEAAEIAKAKITLEDTRRQKDRTLHIPGIGQAGITTRDVETTKKRKDEEKGSPRATSQAGQRLDADFKERVMKAMKAARPNSKIGEVVRMHNGQLFVEIDGKFKFIKEN